MLIIGVEFLKLFKENYWNSALLINLVLVVDFMFTSLFITGTSIKADHSSLSKNCGSIISIKME